MVISALTWRVSTKECESKSGVVILLGVGSESCASDSTYDSSIVVAFECVAVADNRFAGNMDGKYNPEVHRQYIFGMHIGSYMQYRKGDGDGDDEYRAQFSRYIKAKLETAADFEAMYQKVHDTIRKTAVATTEGQRKAKQAAKKAKHAKDTKSAVKKARLSCSQRHARASLKIQKGVPWTHKVAKAPVAAKVAAKGGKAAPKK
jgi:hypothetical protein